MIKTLFPLSPLSLEFRRRGGFNIASTSPSAYYDRTNLAALFQDSAGTTPVTAVTQPIGLGLDQSGGGNNQIQATAGKRPILSSRINQLDASYGAGLWVDNVNAVVTHGHTGPAGSATATLFVPNAGAPTGAFQTRISGVSKPPIQPNAYQEATESFKIKAAGMTRIQTSDGSGEYMSIDLVAMTITGGSALIINKAITDAGDGWRLVKYTYAGNTARSAAMNPNILYYTGSETADGAKGVYTDEWQVEFGVVATRYQRLTTATDYDTVGFPTYADFDQVDDDLVATFPASLGSGCTVCRSLPSTGASITTGVTLTATYTDNVDAHALLIYTAAQWAALDAGQIAKITAWLNAKAGL